ncbi:MAG: MBOAT family protein [Clostridia bacterium]|nr:MBOAT family protein [Clostridia bacterium]
MVFSSTVFLFLFLPIVLIIYYNPIIKNRKFKNLFLLIVSLLFYAYGEPVFIFFMLFSIMVNYLLGRLVAQSPKGKKGNSKHYVTIAYIYNLFVLFIFKYLTFVLKEFNLLFKNDSFTINIALPIGISFFTFQMLSYVIDVYKDPKKVQKNIINVALYVSLFPQLIAGPIVRYETVANELENRKENINDFICGLYRFIYGLGKKVLISNYVGLIADNIFQNIQTSPIAVGTAWIGAIAYTLQIYFDFSGYSDMAIGLGKMFGFHFDENFNYPYIAKSITDFWRRWHISLSTWFRDYVYIPLGGNRVSSKRQIFNLFVVWLFTGIWHGANWTFIVWGLYYLILLLIEKKTKFMERVGKFSHLFTILFVIIGWVIFRADSLSIALSYIGNMFGIKANGLVDNMTIDYIKLSGFSIVIGIILSTPIIKALCQKININDNVKSSFKTVTALAIFILSVLACVRSTYNPFIYFNF